MERLRLLPKIIPMGCGPLPVPSCRHGLAVDIPNRSMRPQPAPGLTLSLIMSPEVIASAHPDQAGRPGAGFCFPQALQEVVVKA